MQILLFLDHFQTSKYSESLFGKNEELIDELFWFDLESVFVTSLKFSDDHDNSSMAIHLIITRGG